MIRGVRLESGLANFKNGCCPKEKKKDVNHYFPNSVTHRFKQYSSGYQEHENRTSRVLRTERDTAASTAVRAGRASSSASARDELGWWASPSQKEPDCGIHPLQRFVLCTRQEGHGNPDRAATESCGHPAPTESCGHPALGARAVPGAGWQEVPAACGVTRVTISQPGGRAERKVEKSSMRESEEADWWETPTAWDTNSHQ